MTINTKRTLTIVGGITLLTVTFYLGHMTGSNNNRTKAELASKLTPSDMEHAFGNVKSPELETINPQPAAMSLSGLVAGLEKKVAANPENIDQQLLLAQTYNELDNRDKSLKLLRSLNIKTASNTQVKITIATILMTGTDKQELKEALQLFDEAVKLKPEVTKMARLYQGEIKAKLAEKSK